MQLVVRRTTLRPGAADEYRRVHSRVPQGLEDALRSAGVTRWSIWRDGDHLIHFIETRDGVDEMTRRMGGIGPIDPEWDAVIATLIEDGPDATTQLEPIWLMTPEGQLSGNDIHTAAAVVLKPEDHD